MWGRREGGRQRGMGEGNLKRRMWIDGKRGWRRSGSGTEGGNFGNVERVMS